MCSLCLDSYYKKILLYNSERDSLTWSPVGVCQHTTQKFTEIIYIEQICCQILDKRIKISFKTLAFYVVGLILVVGVL